MIAVDWSHTKGLTTFDGKKLRTEDKGNLLRRLRGESTVILKSRKTVNPQIIIEEGCPLSLIYDLAEIGYSIGLIDNHATENYRRANGIEKTDENDAKIIHYLANNGTKPRVFEIDENVLLMHNLYHQYLKYQKARVAMMNMRKAHERSYGGESNFRVKSISEVNPPSDLSPYDDSITILHKREKSILKSLIVLIEGRESRVRFKSNSDVNRPSIKGLGDRIWIGILVTANPINFKNVSGYLRFCGLTNDVMQSHRYNRHAKMLYHMLAEAILKAKDPIFRSIYDKCKEDIREKYPDYTKLHIHNAALNRTSTFLAKRIYECCQNNTE